MATWLVDGRIGRCQCRGDGHRSQANEEKAAEIGVVAQAEAARSESGSASKGPAAPPGRGRDQRIAKSGKGRQRKCGRTWEGQVGGGFTVEGES